MRATTGGASASRPRPLTRRQQKIVAVARRSVTARGHEIQQVARAYKRLNLTPAEQRLANRAAEQHGAHLRKLQGSNLHNFVSDAQKISQGLLDTAGLHGAAHPLARLQHPGGEMMFPGFGKNPSSLVKGLRAKRVMPADMAPEVEASAKKLTAGLTFGGARKAREAQDFLHSEERARRAQAAEEAMRATPGEAGYHNALRELKGELPKGEFNALKGKLSPDEVQGLHTHISNTDRIRPLDKVKAHGALNKVLQGGVPTNYERKLLHRAFGPEFVKAIESGQPVSQHVLDALNIPRSVMASADVSAPFRQGLVAGARHPVMFSKNLPSMMHQLVSEDFHQQVMAGIHKHPLYQDFVDHGGPLTELGPLHGREEQFMSNLAERIPVIGHIVRASGRAYVGFLDQLRMQMYAHHVEGAEKFYGGPLSAKQKRGLTNFIGSATGRGDLGRFENAAVHLNTLFFSPRLLASRVNLLNPRYYAKLDPYSRRQALRSMAGLVTFVGSVLELAHLAGAHVGMDPRNSDWAKIKIGNTRIDLLGGFQQPVRLAAQELSGKAISSTTGDPLTLGPGIGNMSRQDILKRFFEGKLAPTPSVVNDFLKGEDFQGNKFSLKNEAASHLVPLTFQDAKDLYHDQGSIPKAVGGYAIGATGIGVQTYGPKDKTKAAKEANAKLAQAFEQHVQQYFHQGLTPQIKRALRLRQERQVWMAQNTDKNSTAVERYNAQVDLMLKKKMITPKQANHAKAWAKTQDPHVLKSRTSSLGSKYFGGTVLNSAAKKIRDRGGTHFYLSNY